MIERMRVHPSLEFTSTIPPRSMLHTIEPIGVGTAFVEGLTSYVMRLAEAHSVRVGDLVGRVLNEIPNPHGKLLALTFEKMPVNWNGFRSCRYTINGGTDRTQKWIYALETATGQTDLRFLTMLPFRYLLSERLFSRHRTWCSLCLDESQSRYGCVYEPLLWGIKSVSHCPVHECVLSFTCPHCQRKSMGLGAFSRPGYCDRCHGWLGQSLVEIPMNSTEAESSFRCSRQVANLLKTIRGLDPAAAPHSFRRSLYAYIEHSADGNVSALAKHIQCGMSILDRWLRKGRLPHLENLLRTSLNLGVPVSELLNPSGPTAESITIVKREIIRVRVRFVSPHRKQTEIRQALLEALNEALPVRVSDVARRLNYVTDGSLYRASTDLCQRISQRFRESGRDHRSRKQEGKRIHKTNRFREALELSLEAKIPVSIGIISNSLGYPSAGNIRQKYPELCLAIQKRFAEFKLSRRRRIRQSLEKALIENPAPKFTDLCRRPEYSCSPRFLRAQEPELCAQIAGRYQVHLANQKANMLRAAEALLLEDPAPSLKEVRDRLGMTEKFMEREMAMIRCRIRERHRQYVAVEAKRQRQLIYESARIIATKLSAEGIYPSIDSITKFLPEGCRRSQPLCSQAVHEARQALGL